MIYPLLPTNNMTKMISGLSLSLLLSACALGGSSEIQQAEKLLQQFQCHNIETLQMQHSPLNSFYQQSLAASREKVETYIESYKAGDELFDVPLRDVVQQQFQLYTSACEALGGIHLKLEIE